MTSWQSKSYVSEVCPFYEGVDLAAAKHVSLCLHYGTVWVYCASVIRSKVVMDGTESSL